ncbi:hypothetical protein [Dyadobacter sp. 3J3]|uniref:hypothetical protein n=1 Tax=Dyadobacter sp. 3J3 TaxID=2606600 RepID=UPI001E5C12FF|nr:hypothetical protein [Dyadobacter sp. 3J3]
MISASGLSSLHFCAIELFPRKYSLNDRKLEYHDASRLARTETVSSTYDFCAILNNVGAIADSWLLISIGCTIGP